MLRVLQRKPKTKRAASSITLLAMLLAPLLSLADSSFNLAYRHASLDRLHRPNASLTPTRMMNNDQLFLAAETLKNKQASRPQLQANHFWLRSHQGDCYEGTAALRKFLSLTLSNMYPTLKYSGEKYADGSEDSDFKESSYSLKDLDNYSLRLSQRRVSLKFKYKF